MTSIGNIKFGNIDPSYKTPEDKEKAQESYETRSKFNAENPGAVIDLYQKLGVPVNEEQKQSANEFRTKYPNLAQYKQDQ